MMVPFPKRLQEARKRKKLRQTDVAEHFAIAYRTYQNYEGGQRRPDFELLVALADYLEVTTDYLLGRTDEPD
ncbi:MAG: helix-turn-helix transcriptional regulator [Clostridiales bacterium]|nr:helix-turn-helix transcriptional regulator [Clostridiales bacterium]